MKSKHGISPVVASIIIILVAVTLAGTYTVWANQLFGGVQEEGEGEIGRTTQALTSSLSISSASDQKVFIKNTGSSELSASAVEVFVDDEPVSFTADFNTLSQDELGALTLQRIWSIGGGSHGIRVTAGGFSDSADLRVEPHRSIAGFWRFEGGTGEIAEDFSGNDNTGTLKDADTGNGDGETLPQWVDGRVGTALDFDGVDDYVTMGDTNSVVDGQVEITVTGWFKAATIPSDSPNHVDDTGKAVTSKTGNGDNNMALILGNDDEVYFYLDTGGSGDSKSITTSSSPVSEGKWHSVTGTWNGETMKLYVDGEEVLTEPFTGDGTLQTNGNPLYIGAGKDNSGNRNKFFDGTIDEMAIYSQALEPRTLYTLSLTS